MLHGLSTHRRTEGLLPSDYYSLCQMRVIASLLPAAFLSTDLTLMYSITASLTGAHGIETTPKSFCHNWDLNHRHHFKLIQYFDSHLVNKITFPRYNVNTIFKRSKVSTCHLLFLDYEIVKNQVDS